MMLVIVDASTVQNVKLARSCGSPASRSASTSPLQDSGHRQRGCRVGVECFSRCSCFVICFFLQAFSEGLRFEATLGFGARLG